MTYRRVIPRDLFNEASLLKCMGQLYLELEKLGLEDSLIDAPAGDPFKIEMSEYDSSISIKNVILRVRGDYLKPYRPINSRGPWKLLVDTEDAETIPIFRDDGTLTKEMHAFLTRSDYRAALSQLQSKVRPTGAATRKAMSSGSISSARKLRSKNH